MTEKLRLSTKINYTNKKSDNLPATGYNNQTVMYWNIMQVPNGNLDWLKEYWMPGKEGVDQSYPFSTSPDNPYLIVNEMLNKLNRHTVTGNVQMNYDIIKGLNLMVRGSMDMSYEDRSEQLPGYAEVQIRHVSYHQNICSGNYGGLLAQVRKEDFSF